MLLYIPEYQYKAVAAGEENDDETEQLDDEILTFLNLGELLAKVLAHGPSFTAVEPTECGKEHLDEDEEPQVVFLLERLHSILIDLLQQLIGQGRIGCKKSHDIEQDDTNGGPEQVLLGLLILHCLFG